MIGYFPNMALTELEQIRQTINQARHVLITFRKDATVDAISGALALALVLQKINKLVDVTCDGFQLPANLAFLPGADGITGRLQNLQKLIISLHNSRDNIDQFSYDMENGDLKIYLTPKAGAFQKSDVKTEQSDYKYDLVITVDAPDLDSLGDVYRQATDFFYRTTIINLDHHVENEHYGQINRTNPNAVASCEVIYQLLRELNQSLIGKEVATCLLTGIISKTKSFRTGNVTPATLEIASALMAAEADRETIVKNLFRNRSLPTLRLWGRALARLKSEPGDQLAWALLTEHDFLEARADEINLPGVVDELISFIPGIDVAVLIYQQKGVVSVVVEVLTDTGNALQLTRQFKPGGSKRSATFSLPDKTLVEAEQAVIETIRRNLGAR